MDDEDVGASTDTPPLRFPVFQEMFSP